VCIDEGTALAVLNAAARHGELEIALDVWAQIERSFEVAAARIAATEVATRRTPSVLCYHAIIHAYAAAGDIRCGLILALMW
jgi:hypothetical protein